MLHSCSGPPASRGCVSAVFSPAKLARLKLTCLPSRQMLHDGQGPMLHPGSGGSAALATRRNRTRRNTRTLKLPWASIPIKRLGAVCCCLWCNSRGGAAGCEFHFSARRRKKSGPFSPSLGGNRKLEFWGNSPLPATRVDTLRNQFQLG